MPDDYENLYGFNPNDASDAAKDFDGDGVSNLDEYKAGTNPADVTKPTIISASSTSALDTVFITFSEALDAVSATTVANYTITPALAVKAASIKNNVVTLTTDKQAPGATQYTVAVANVVDSSKNAVAAGTKAVFFSYLNIKEGVLKMSIYTGIGGNAIQAMLDDAKYPNSPDRVGAVFSANSRDLLPTDSLESYGAAMNGYLTPTESGAYDFFLRSDDAGQFYISTDDKESNLALVAEETGCCDGFKEPGTGDETTASPINLVAGKKYFISVLYKEGGGGDYGQVAWRKVGDPTPSGSLTPIPGKFLSSAVDLPVAPEGAYVTQSPGVNAKGVSPAAAITIAHRDGKTAWTAANTSLKLDGAVVTPTVTKDGQVLTLTFKPSGIYASGSVHTIELGYPDPAGKAATTTWSFTAGTYNGTVADSVGGYKGLLLGASVYTADGLGHSGKAGDKAIDLTKKGGSVAVFDAQFLAVANAATANDELTVSFWQKKYDTADSSAFTLDSPSAGNNRNFHAHVPWSNQNVYFDTVGCCDGSTQRITADIVTFPDYSGTADWWTTQWHHFVFTKKGADKNIYIDGKLFLNGQSTNPLKTDSQAFYMGSGSGGAEISHAIIDDFAVFNKALAEADALAITKGTSPSALPAAKGLIAFWDYNSAPVVITTPTIGIGADGKISYTGTLLGSDTASGPFAPVAGATNPFAPNTGAAAQKFYRSSN